MPNVCNYTSPDTTDVLPQVIQVNVAGDDDVNNVEPVLTQIPDGTDSNNCMQHVNKVPSKQIPCYGGIKKDSHPICCATGNEDVEVIKTAFRRFCLIR